MFSGFSVQCFITVLSVAVSTRSVPARGHECTHTVGQTEQGREMSWRRREVPGNGASMAICGQAGTTLVDLDAFALDLILG